MSKLQYITSMNEYPQGKPYVYFSCHPEDFNTYFKKYSDKIMDIEDCAVWYESEPEAGYDREELALDLNRMRLFVMPVTRKLLTTPNRAMDVEYPIAKENHIPVLPLMMEQDLEYDFTGRFGDLQYLTPNDTDETKRGFDEVLEGYIRSVLVSSDLAKRVRAAFDAYIFLSYRKKDRKKAQELMHLIHRNPLCRDIAIWYDEFLVPGEDFNQAIGKMLEKSDLFTLVVTPNLVNEVNYVMTMEYPAAVSTEKPVLPVEMVETDRRELEAHYEALPPCVRGDDSEEFHNTLLYKLRKIALAVNKDDPEHNFLIGLAYLDGIDVEVNAERALKLITGAAEAGVPEAISHLITMYETGKGIERDHLKEIEWREKQVALLRKKYESDPGWHNAWELIDKSWDLGDALFNLRKLDSAKSVYLEMSGLAEKYAASGSREFRRRYFVCYDKLGNIERMGGSPDKEWEYYKKGHAIIEELAKEAGTPDVYMDLILSCSKLGDCAKKEGDLSGAREYYERGLVLCETLLESRLPVVRRYMSAICCKLGDIAKGEGNLSGARKYYAKCLSIAETLERGDKTIELRRIQYVSFNRLGDIARTEGNLAEAQEHFEKCLSVSKELAEVVGTVEPREDLAISYSALADIARERGNLIEAEEYYGKSRDIREALAKETGSLQAYRYYAAVLFNSGVFYYISLQNLSRAKVMFEKVYEIAGKFDDGYLADLGLKAEQALDMML